MERHFSHQCLCDLKQNYSNVLPEFIEKILTSNDFIQKALKFQEGTVYERMAVKADDFLKLVIKLPASPNKLSAPSSKSWISSLPFNSV